MPIYAVSRFAVGVEPGRQEQLLIKLGHCITYLLIHQKDIQMPKDSEKVESNE